MLPGSQSALLSGPVEGWVLLVFVGLFGVAGSLYALWRISHVVFPDQSRPAMLSAAPFFMLIVYLGVVFEWTLYHWLIIT